MTDYTYIEYGVIVDRTERGLGKYLASTHRDLKRAHTAAKSYEHYPATVKQRTVHLGEWEDVE